MKTKEKIRELLEAVDSLKDSDNRLCTHMWFRELEQMGIDPFEMKATDFLKIYAMGDLTPAPSIKRLRAKLQEQHIHLRGDKYNMRKEKMQDKWRKDLGYGENYNS